MPKPVNFAENQRRYDGDTPLDMCEAKGREHKAYGWASRLRGGWSQAQIDSYNRGFNGESSNA